MFLHDAMVVILKEQCSKSMHIKKLSEIISQRHLYEKRDKSKLESKQVSARARAKQYSHLFKIDNDIVYLR